MRAMMRVLGVSGMLTLACAVPATGWAANEAADDKPGAPAGGEGVTTEANSVVAVAASQPANHEALLQAIRERRMLHFSYGGHVRVVEPHAYGVTAAGEIVVHGYQTAGGSASQPPPGWRTFGVAGMSDVLVTGRSFSKPRSGYSAEALKLDPLWAEVIAAERSLSTP